MIDKDTCIIYLVRHGETKWNKDGTVMGQLDSPLTRTGVSQAEETAKKLKGINFKVIFSSDLDRARRTAEIIKLNRDLAIQTSSKLRERTYGGWEGKKGDDFRREFQHVFKGLKELSAEEQKALKLADDIESDQEVINRFTSELKKIALSNKSKTVLIVTHGGCIRTFLMNTGFAKYGELKVGSFSNAGYAKISSDGVHFSIIEVEGIKTT